MKGEKIEIKINREDLKGNYSSIEDCPIARASKRYFNTTHILVGYTVDILNSRHNEIIKVYSTTIKDRSKALTRGGNSLWGKLIGGFTMELTEI